MRLCGVVKDQTQTSQLGVIHLFHSRAARRSDEKQREGEKAKTEGC